MLKGLLGNFIKVRNASDYMCRVHYLFRPAFGSCFLLPKGVIKEYSKLTAKCQKQFDMKNPLSNFQGPGKSSNCPQAVPPLMAEN